jgi:hypothetical protein
LLTGRRWAKRIALLIVTAGLATACTAGPSERPGIVVRDAPPATTQEPGGEPEVPPLEEMTDSMAWRDCSEEIRERLAAEELPGWLPVECGKINAVMDSPYAPGRGNIRLQVLRAGAGKVPIVVLNDVGGLPGTIYAAHLAKTLPQGFFEKFTLIGVDRRGTGNSGAAGCVPEEIRRAMVDPDPADLPIDIWLQAAQTAGQQCSIQLETHLPAYDTRRSACPGSTASVTARARGCCRCSPTATRSGSAGWSSTACPTRPRTPRSRSKAWPRARRPRSTPSPPTASPAAASSAASPSGRC